MRAPIETERGLLSGTVLITGATGFLGGHIAAGLARAGARVRCTHRKTSDTRWIDSLEVETTELDLAKSRPESEKALLGIDTVVHCGGVTRASTSAEFHLVNAGGTERLAKAAGEAGASRFVFISSLAARGPDGHDGPVSPYGRSKLEAEERLSRLRDHMDLVILRPGGVYGPRDSDLLPMFQMAGRGFLVIPRSPAPLQPIFVDDVTDAVVRAVSGPVPDAPLPLAERVRYGWTEVAQALGEALERRVKAIRVPYATFWTAGLLGELGSRITRRAPAMDRRQARDFARYSWTCDPSSTEAALGWKARVALPEGLVRTASWYREVGWL
jgi:nucleoside-diphosphate-sugar epimerase